MASLEKKIQLSGWSKRAWREVRHRAEEMWKKEEAGTLHKGKISLKKNNKLCKKNHDKPHEFIKIIKQQHKDWKAWTDFECRYCGKQTYTYDRKLF